MSRISPFSRSTARIVSYRRDNSLGFRFMLSMVTMVTMMIKSLVAN